MTGSEGTRTDVTRTDATVPWPPSRVSDDPTDGADIDRLMVFVPAIMSVGLIFSIATLVRDAFHWTGDRSRERRTGIEAGAVVHRLLNHDEPDPDDIGILSRPAYLISAIVLVGGAAYITIGSVANFVRDGGYVSDIGWLLAVSLGLAVILGFLGGVSLVLFLTWPHPPPWTFGPLRAAPLTSTPGRHGEGPSWGVAAGIWAMAVVTGVISLIVGSGRSVAMDIDRPIAEWLVEAQWLDRLEAIDIFGGTWISVAFVAVIGLSAFRCRVMAITYPAAFLVGWAGNATIREIVERPRPLGPGDMESFPSGHLVQATFIAGLVPLAIIVLLSNRRLAIVTRAVLAVAVVATGLHRIHRQDHWPLDVLAGVTLGLTVVLGAHWVMAHRSWHGRCRSCPWSDHPTTVPWRRGVFTIDVDTARRLDLLGVAMAVAGSVGLFALTVSVGIPVDPEGYGFSSSISQPVQLTLAGLLGLFGLVAIRWRATAAVGIAFVATGLGLFAAVQYRPAYTIALTAVLLVPAVIIWLSWQRNETIGRIGALAAATITLLGGTGYGSNRIYNFYFGPTHPESVAADLDSDAEWLWLGAVTPHSATVVAGGLDQSQPVELRLWPVGGNAGTAGEAVMASADEFGLARLTLSGLTPATDYRYAVTELDDAGSPDDTGQDGGDAGFRTPDVGPQDLVIVASSCARSGSNGAVFDAMVAEQPDLYLAIGDLHYANLESTSPADHIQEYARALRSPGQAALFSSTPTAYVWDDHDFGPNDSDSSSASRPAVAVAYRSAVPNHGVDPSTDGDISQAFTVGRVRFIMTDTRSQRTAESILGPEQEAWLIDELTAASKAHALVVWANPTPWIGSPNPAADDWSFYPAERGRIADAIAAAGVDNLVMVSGDAHMLAIDDGSNSDYSTVGDAGFPVLHAAALDRPGSVKGGPYSHGAFPGAGQYGRIEINDDGGNLISVRLSGHSWQGDEVVALDLEFPVGAGSR